MSNPDPQSSLDERFAEFCRRVDRGDEIDLESFLAESAEKSSEVAELLEMAALVEAMAGPEVTESQDDTVEWDEDRTNPGTLPRRLSELELPYRIGDYILQKRLGEGGMGVVYHAHQLSLDRDVAVKMILSGRFASPEDRARFHMEAKAAARLNHPNIVHVHEVQFVDGHDFFSMELIEGRGLNEFIEDNSRLPPKQAARYIRDIADAIDVAHQRGLIHRDLKPANILVDESDQVHITDFGLSKQIDSEDDLTATGMAVGTPTYMAPEQASATGDTVAVDIYSLGATLYALLVGRPPFRGKTSLETLIQARSKPPEPVRTLNDDVDKDLETICLKCLEKEPAERYLSASELAADLDRYLKGEPIEAKRPGWHVRAVHSVQSKKVSLGFFIAGLVLLIAVMLGLQAFQAANAPVQLKIASGQTRGGYYAFARRLAQEVESRLDHVQHVEILETEGSGENVERVARDKTFIGLAQREALPAANVVVVAPLFSDVVCLVTRRSIESISELRPQAGQPPAEFAIGSQRSGMVMTAERLLEFLQTSAQVDVRAVKVAFDALAEDADRFTGAIVTSRLDNQLFNLVLQPAGYRIHPIPNAENLVKQDPSFELHTIRPADIPRWKIPTQGIRTVKTTTFLVCHKELRNDLVRRILEVIYRETDLVQSAKLMSSSDVSWQDLDLHPEARRFFAQGK